MKLITESQLNRLVDNCVRIAIKEGFVPTGVDDDEYDYFEDDTDPFAQSRDLNGKADRAEEEMFATDDTDKKCELAGKSLRYRKAGRFSDPNF